MKKRLHNTWETGQLSLVIGMYYQFRGDLSRSIRWLRRSEEIMKNIGDPRETANALLRSARTISSEETLYLLSLIRLGVTCGRVPDVELKTVNELFLLTQPAHLQHVLHRQMSPQERSEARALYIRQRFGAKDSGSSKNRGSRWVTYWLMNIWVVAGAW